MASACFLANVLAVGTSIATHHYLGGIPCAAFAAASPTLYRAMTWDAGREPETTVWSREEWERAYDEAIQWRDWQLCDQLIEERDRAGWYEPEVYA